MPTGDPVLRKAVADLIEPRTVRFVQRPPGGGWRVAEVVHEPLIQVIRQAIAGNTGSKAGGASDPTTRMPIDPGALAVYDDLVRETTRWYQGLANRPAPELPEEALLDWLELFEHSLVHPEDDAAAAVEVARKVRKLLWWERRILDQFDPPEQFEVAAVVDEPVISRHTGLPVMKRDGTVATNPKSVPADCPKCGHATAWDPATGNTISALVITYRQSEAERAMTAAVGLCRSCEWTWRGASQLREMRAAIDAQGAGHAA